mgnify:CR=1 FL=1
MAALAINDLPDGRRVLALDGRLDSNTVRAVCDDIVVLYAGNKVEAVPRAAFSLGDVFIAIGAFGLLAWTGLPEKNNRGISQ